MLKNFRLRTLQIFLIALVLFFLSPGALADETVASKPPGAGTAQDPMRIENLAHLRWLSEDATAADLGKVYKLMNDIDASETETWTHDFERIGFLPIGGTSSVPVQFTGYFNGNNKTISNLYINVSATRVGFIRHIGIGEGVQNLTLENLRIAGRNTMGAVAGINEGNIVNVSVDVHMTIPTDNQADFGGLVGFNRGLIVRSHANITMEAVAGQELNPRKVGGLVGRNGQPGVEPEIRDSYATGRIQGSAGVGGLVGDMFSGIIVSSFAAVEVRGSSGAPPSALGGFFGYQETGVLVTGSYWSPEISGRPSSGSLDAEASVQSRTKAQMLGSAARTSMSGLNFNNTWQTTLSSADRCTIGLPELRVLAYRPSPFVESTLSGGTGSIDDPCLIENWNDLHNARDHLSAAFALNANLDNQTAGYADRVTNPSGGFGPIGTNSSPFRGSFDGRGYGISDLIINRPSVTGVGLFGYLDQGASIQNLGVAGNVTGLSRVGGVVGELPENAFLDNVSMTGQITANESLNAASVGGLVGWNAGSITDASTDVTVTTSGDDAGGLVGTNQGGSVQKASVVGSVTGKGLVGGLIGHSQSGRISQSQTNVTVSASTTSATGSTGVAGGLIGRSYFADRVTESNSRGSVTGRVNGGLIGEMGFGAVVQDNFSTTTLKGNPQHAGALVGGIDDATLRRAYFAGVDQTNNGADGLVAQTTSATIAETYWDSDVLNLADNGTGTGLTTQAFITASTFSNWNLTSIWALGTTDQLSYPYLRNNSARRPEITLTLAQSNPINGASLVALSPGVILLEFNIDVSLGDAFNIELFRNNDFSTWSTLSVAGKTVSINYDPKVSSDYVLELKPGALVASANNQVTHGPIEISFSTIPFAEGDGTSSSPYQINGISDIRNLGNAPDLWDKHFQLTRSIILPAREGSRVELPPIGPFTGVFDGQGFFIRNLVVKQTNNAPAGFFQEIGVGGEVKDLHLVDFDVSGPQRAGILAGINRGLIQTSSASGTVTSTQGPAGGLIGEHLGRVEKVFAAADVIAPDELGGLVGIMTAPNSTDAAEIENAYSTSTVHVPSDVQVAGGLIGKTSGLSSILYAYVAGALSVTPEGASTSSSTIDGLIGSIDTTKTSLGFLHFIDTWPATGLTKSSGDTEADLKTQSTFTNWDFSSVWQIVNEPDGTVAVDPPTIVSYPYLRDLPYDPIAGDIDRMPIPGLGEKEFADGVGSQADPFIINNWRHLNNIRNQADSKYYRLGADLTSDTVGYPIFAANTANSDAGWDPLPSAIIHLDGNGHQIADLVINRPSTDQVGLFKELKVGSTIDDLLLVNASVTGNAEVGILAGVNRGAISLSATLGSVTATIEEPDNFTPVDAVAGGLVGFNYGVIETSYSSANVEGTGEGFFLGGLVGINEGSIEDAYATGSVEGAGGVGGLVGLLGLNSGSTANITRAYATGLVQNGDDSFTGAEGLVAGNRIDWGADGATDRSPSSVWDIETTGQSDPGDSSTFPSVGVGKTTSQMKTKPTFTTDLGGNAWDFDGANPIWCITNQVEGDDTIVSYPYLCDNPQYPNVNEDYLQDFEPTNPGAGTVDAPYRITQWRHLANIAKDPSAYFVLVNDLVADANDADYQAFASASANNGLGWAPILDASTPFTGHLDGNGKTISGLVINRPDENNIGLFSAVGNGATIKDLTISATIEGRSSVGAIAGIMGNSSLINVRVEETTIVAGSVPTKEQQSEEIDENALASSFVGGLIGQVKDGGSITNGVADRLIIRAEGSRVGGLVGYIENGQLLQSNVTVQLSAPGGVGGLVGRLGIRAGTPDPRIEQSWANVAIETGDCPAFTPDSDINITGIGGLAGVLDSINAEINQSYASVSIQLGDNCQRAAGLVGYNNLGTIENSYVLGQITAGDNSQHIASVMGDHFNPPAITNSYGAVDITVGANGQNIGGLIGSVAGFSGINESFYNQDLIGNANDDCDSEFAPCGEGKTTLELKDPATFANWSLSGSTPIWQMASGDDISYPYLVDPEQTPAPGLEGAPMRLVYDTSLGNGTTIRLPFDRTVNVTIDWGDGSTPTTHTESGFVSHTYSGEGQYTVNIYGELQQFGQIGGFFTEYEDAEKLIAVESFGNIGIESLDWAFKSASNLEQVPATLPSTVRSMRGTFAQASKFNDANVTSWDVGNVTNFSRMFARATAFNQNIGGWSVDNATDMSSTFFRARAFNQPLNDWNVENVTSFYRMFEGAWQFNQDLNSWTTNQVTTMQRMFFEAATFNGKVDQWNTGNVTLMNRMFDGATNFDQPIGNWDVSKVTTFDRMFARAITFDQDISGWSPTAGTDFGGMFWSAYSFNQPIGQWGEDVKKATNMAEMFGFATSFDQDISSWDFSNVTNLSQFLDESGFSSQNYDALLISLAGQTLPNNVTLGALPIRYSEGTAATARSALINEKGWAILDGGPVPTFSGGDGQADTPHLISNLDDLRTLSEDPEVWGLDYQLTQDIDASQTVTWNGGQGLSPIGNSAESFTGTFNGNGYRITGLAIKRPQQEQVGLFGNVSGIVSGLTLIDADIEGFNRVGGVVGYNNGTVLDVGITGIVKGSVGVGGLVGFNTVFGSIASSASHADVEGSNAVGGVIGEQRGALLDAYSQATITSGGTVGGLVGTLFGPRSIIDTSYSASILSTSGQGQAPGGIAGSVGSQDATTNGGEVSHTYFLGDFNQAGVELASAGNYTIDATKLEPVDLKTQSGIGADADWDINGASSEWALLSVDSIQANGKFYRSYPYLKILSYDEPGSTATGLTVPGLTEMPQPPSISESATEFLDGNLVITFTASTSTADATITGYDYSLDNGQTWQASGQTSSPIVIDGLESGGVYQIRLRTQTNMGPGPRSDVYRLAGSSVIFQDRFQVIEEK